MEGHLTKKHLRVTICSAKSDSFMGPTRKNPVLENLQPPDGPVLQILGPTCHISRCLHSCGKYIIRHDVDMAM